LQTLIGDFPETMSDCIQLENGERITVNKGTNKEREFQVLAKLGTVPRERELQ